MDNQPLKIKLNTIQSEIKKLQKEGYNNFHKYKYLAESQITELFKDLFATHGVIFNVSAEIISQTIIDGNILTHVRVKYSFKDIHSNEEITGAMDGQGIDKGDKGVYKAITGAVKYIFMKNFLIPTGDDPEEVNDIEKPVKKNKSVDYSIITDQTELNELTTISIHIKEAKTIDEIKEIAKISQNIKLSNVGRDLLRQEANIKIKELNKNA